jgi:hypothetical protein
MDREVKKIASLDPTNTCATLLDEAVIPLQRKPRFNLTIFRFRSALTQLQG